MHPRIEASLKEHPLIKYTVHEHTMLPVPIRGPQDFAEALGYDLERITKTLFVKGNVSGAYGMVVCSVDKKVDFVVLAREMGCKHVQVARREELEQRVGYPPFAVSPIGVEGLPIFLDQDLMNLETVLVGGGEMGVEIEMGPRDLQVVTGGVVMKIVVVQ